MNEFTYESSCVHEHVSNEMCNILQDESAILTALRTLEDMHISVEALKVRRTLRMYFAAVP